MGSLESRRLVTQETPRTLLPDVVLESLGTVISMMVQAALRGARMVGTSVNSLDPQVHEIDNINSGDIIWVGEGVGIKVISMGVSQNGKKCLLRLQPVGSFGYTMVEEGQQNVLHGVPISLTVTKRNGTQVVQVRLNISTSYPVWRERGQQSVTVGKAA